MGAQTNSFRINDRFPDECGENLTRLCKKYESIDEYGFLALREMKNGGLVELSFSV